MNTGITYTLNPTTDQEKKLYSHRFYTLLQHGYIYDEELNQLYHNSLLSVLKSIFFPYVCYHLVKDKR